MKSEAKEPAFPVLGEDMDFSGPTVDITEFGATANDDTDDTAAIQAALDSLAQDGGTLTFEPDAVYTVTEGLLVQDAENFKIDGNGATIAVAEDAAIEEGGAALRIEESSHFAVADLTVDDGRETGSPSEASSMPDLEVADGEDFFLSQVSSVNFENIGGPAVNLSILGTVAPDDGAVAADLDREPESGLAAEVEADAGVMAGTEETGTADPGSPDGGDDSLLQSASGVLSGQSDGQTLDFDAVGGEAAGQEPDPAEDQRLLEGPNGPDQATGGGDATAAVSPEPADSGSDDVALLGVNAQAHELGGDFATS